MLRRETLQSERGSALVLVMFIVLLLTILGVTVLSATIGGARRSETRENDVQSLHLAQKSIDEAIAYITGELDKKLETSSNTTQVKFDEEIIAFLNEFNKNKKAFITDTSLQGADNEITGIILDSGSTSSKHIVTIKANATVNGVLRTLQQKVVISTFPDFLNYSLGSEGTIYLNGAPHIQGNIYAGNQLKISEVAKYIHNANLERQTLFPLIDGESHIQSMEDLLYSRTGGIHEKVPSVDDSRYSSLDERVKRIIERAKIKKKTTFVQVNVEDSFLDKVAEASGSADNKRTYSDKYYELTGAEGSEKPTLRGERLITWLQQSSVIPTLRMPTLEEFEDIATGDTDEEKEQEKNRLYEEARLSLKQNLANLMSSTIFTGDLELDGVQFREIRDSNKVNSINEAHWLIVNGDLTIDNYSTQPIEIQSNILVTGDLYIKGKSAFDSTMFILGKTDIVDATISGITIVGKGSKELVLISKGAILINRVEEFKDEATRLRAFFYTDSTAELYGVGSIFSLDGGFFAKGDLIINAVVGKVTKEVGSNQFRFDTQTNFEPPRFTVNYNEKVFEDQNVGLPRVNQINIHVGPIEMLKPEKID